MSVEYALTMMTNYPPSIAATKKAKTPIPEGFVWYIFEWLEDSDIMKVTGTTTRVAKIGKNKGRSILDRGADKRTVYITADEIKAAHGITGETK